MLRALKAGVKDVRAIARERAHELNRDGIDRDRAFDALPVRIDVDEIASRASRRAARSDAESSCGASELSRCAPRFVSHFGADATSSSVSFAAEQRLLLRGSALGTTCFGDAGLECLLADASTPAEGSCSSSDVASAVRYVPGAMRAYRCASDGSVAVWDARTQRALASGTMTSDDDGVSPSCASEALRGTNFFLTGMSDGSTRVHALGVDGGGRSVVARRRGYEVSAWSARGDVGDAPAVAAVRMRPGREECAHALIAWSDGVLALWHLHERRSCATSTSARDASDGETLTCAEWLDANSVVTGHSDGVVRVWRVRVSEDEAAAPGELVELQSVRPHRTIDPSHKGELAKIRGLKTYVFEDDDAERDVGTWLTCIGGEGDACPDPVICLRATRAGGEWRIESAGAVSLPWFGPVLDAVPIPYRGTIESVCVLSEGAQLHLHDVRYGVPATAMAKPHEVAVNRPALSLTCSPSVCVASKEIEDAFAKNVARIHVDENEIDASFGWKGSKWPFSGGKRAGAESSILRGRIVVGAFGRNGSGVRMYLDRGGRFVSGGCISTNDDPVSRLYVDAGGALLVVGRRSGAVEIYTLRQFASNNQDPHSRERIHVRDLTLSEKENIEREREFFAESPRDFADLDSTAACVTSVYTLIGTYNSPTHSGKPISCIRTNAAATFMAIGDASGGVSLLNIQRGDMVWTAPGLSDDARNAPAGVADFDFGLPLPDAPEDHILAVLEVTSSVRFHALVSGARLGKTMTPKTQSAALAISLLRLDGSPSDIVPPASISGKAWFSPPRSFAYSFLASEFSVEEENVDEEEKVLSTDEEEAETSPQSTPNLTAMVVTVSKDAMRAYHAVGCSRGDKSTLRKIRFEEEALRSACVVRDDAGEDEFGHGRHEPPIAVAMTTSGRILAYDLPSLRPRGSFGPVQPVLNARASAGSRGGAMIVIGDDGLSVSRFETFVGPTPAEGLIIDVDVERAAEAARVARRAMEENDPQLAMGTSPKRDPPGRDATAATPPPSKPLTMGEALRQRAKTAIEKLEKYTAASPTQSDERSTPRASAYTTTDLALLFADARIEEPGAMQTPPVAPRPQNDADHHRREREELFASAKVTPTRADAAAVREKYGRPAATASAVSSQMRDTQDALERRGEKLASMADKSAALEADAANFADLARELRKKSERRWL